MLCTCYYNEDGLCNKMNKDKEYRFLYKLIIIIYDTIDEQNTNQIYYTDIKKYERTNED